MNQNKEFIFIISKILLKVLLPSSIIFLLVWQGVEYSHLNRQIKKLNSKKEDLFKKNYELKASIAAIATSEKLENYYAHNNSFKIGAYNKKTVTIMLPPEKKTFSFYK